MKKYLGYLILSLVLLVSIIINVFQFVGNKDSNIYECRKTTKQDDYKMVETVLIEYDGTGRVISEKIKSVEKFNDANEYKLVKESRVGSKENNYKYKDKDKTIINAYELDFMNGEDDEEIFAWIKYILDGYNEKGYTCKNK